MTYREIYQEGQAALAAAGIEEHALDARLLLSFVCGMDWNALLVHGDREVLEEEGERYLELIRARAKRIPLQQLTGEQDFMGLTFLVNDKVLIPRQDTEILVEEVMKHLHDGMRILDLCTGSGCILLSLLHYSNDCEGVGTDLSGDALALAKTNCERLRRDRRQMAARFVEGDLFAALSPEGGAESREGNQAADGRSGFAGDGEDGGAAVSLTARFDMIVSNPPYIETDVIETLMPEVRDHEPRMALDGGADGLIFYRRIAAEAGAFLHGGGMLFFEIGCHQAEAVRRILEQAGFCEVTVAQDFAGLDRVVRGTWRR